MPSPLQVLIIFASGLFHCETGDLCGASEATVGRIVHKRQSHYKMQLYEYGHFRAVTGRIDGCHVPSKCPSTPDAEKKLQELVFNVPGVCTPNLVFKHC